MIGIVDYGAGNLRSVRNAFAFLGCGSVVLDSPVGLDGIDRLVLPGVGSFGFAMDRLEERGMADALRRWIGSGRPILGICLGLQLLTAGSAESPGVAGLGVFGGVCRKFAAGRVPQIGWNGLSLRREDALLAGIRDGEHFYYANSFYPGPEALPQALAVSKHHVEFPAVLGKENVRGTQFHPEKSGPAGLKLLKNWVESCWP